MAEFKSNKALDRAVEQAINKAPQNFEAVREACLSTLANANVLVRDRANAYGTRLLPQESTPEDVTLAANPAQTHMRVVYPAGNNRFEIYGATEADLDEKERTIRAMF